MRVIAIDWSGAKVGAHRKIWIAEARDGDLVLLERGRRREEVATWLIEQATLGERVIVGMDFAFSFPAWFLGEHACAGAEDMWRLVAEGKAEEWLAECAPPFWGRVGKPQGEDHKRGFRKTEGTTQAKSIFQIGGAGAVGTGSLRGMSFLYWMRSAGFAVWPFTDLGPTQPVLLEIYPRVWSPKVKKSLKAKRIEWLALPRYPQLSPRMRNKASFSEDSFDAAISALAMDSRREELGRLAQATDSVVRREGAIWGV